MIIFLHGSTPPPAARKNSQERGVSDIIVVSSPVVGGNSHYILMILPNGADSGKAIMSHEDSHVQVVFIIAARIEKLFKAMIMCTKPFISGGTRVPTNQRNIRFAHFYPVIASFQHHVDLSSYILSSAFGACTRVPGGTLLLISKVLPYNLLAFKLFKATKKFSFR